MAKALKRTVSLSQLSEEISEIKTRAHFNHWAEEQTFMAVFKDTNTDADIPIGSILRIDPGMIIALDLTDQKAYGNLEEYEDGDYFAFSDISLMSAGIHNENLNREMQQCWANVIASEQALRDKHRKPPLTYPIDSEIDRLDKVLESDLSVDDRYALLILQLLSGQWDDVVDLTNMMLGLAKAQSVIASTIQQILIEDYK